MAQRWKNRPEGSNWGDFGPDDQLGRLNLVTAEKVLQGIAEVREGRTFSLSLPQTIGYPNPRRAVPAVVPSERDGRPYINFPFSLLDEHFTDVMSDDKISMFLQYSTHWDSLAHVGSMFDADGDGVPEAVFYNGHRAGEDVIGPIEYRADGEVQRDPPYGARRLGIETIARKGVQGRGVMIDLHSHFGNENRTVSYDDLMRVMDGDDVVVEEGDLVCLWTGFDELLLNPETRMDLELLQTSCAGLDGRDAKLLQWITDSGVAGIFADNMGVEAQPASPAHGDHYAMAPLHEHCLFRLGVHLGESWRLGELARWLRDNKRTRFLLTAPPLDIPGAVGAPANPIATV